MLIWRPVLEGMCSLVDLKTVLTMDDLLDLHEAINLRAAVQALPARGRGRR